MQDYSQHCKGGTSNQEAPDRDLWGSRAKPFSRLEAKEHSSEGGDEAERQIAAVIEHKPRSARKEIQEPDIECLTEVAVLVPVGGKAGEVVMPIQRNSDCSIVEAWARRWIERPCEPIRDKNSRQCAPPPFGPAAREQESERVAKTDLG